MTNKISNKNLFFLLYSLLVLSLIIIMPHLSYGEGLTKLSDITNNQNNISQTTLEKAKIASLSILKLQNQAQITKEDRLDLIKKIEVALTEIRLLESNQGINSATKEIDGLQIAINSYIVSHQSSDEVTLTILQRYSEQMTEELIEKSVDEY
jgi:hypothetical protein